MVNDADIAPQLLLLSTLATAGYAIALHVRFTVPTHMLQTYPEEWTAEYARDGLVMRDPTLSWAFDHQGRISWDELQPHDEAGVFARAAVHGLRYGMTVSVMRGGSRSVGGFARGDRPYTPEEGEVIEAAMTAIHDATAPAGGAPHG